MPCRHKMINKGSQLARQKMAMLLLSIFFYGNRFMQQQRSQEESYIHKRLSITIAALLGVLSSHTIQIQIQNSVQKFALRVCLFKIMELKL